MAQAGAAHSSGFWGSPHFRAKCRQGAWKVPKQVCISGQREELRCSVSVPKTNCAASFQPWWAWLGLGEGEVCGQESTLCPPVPSRVAVLLPQRVGTQRLPQGALVLAASLETPASLLKRVSNSVGQWRLTADTGNRQIFFSGHWKRAKSFPGCPSGHVLCLYQTQSFPKPCCLDVSFHFSVFCCRKGRGGAAQTHNLSC